MGTFYGPTTLTIPNTDGLVLYLDSTIKRSYPGSGSILYDVSGNQLNATVNSSYINSTALLSGASASTATTSILNTDQHSVFFMIRFEPNGTYPNGYSGSWEKIFSYNAGGSDRAPSVWRYPSQRLLHWRFDPSNTGSDFGLVGISTEFSLNTWYYVGVTKNGATANSYVNGNLVVTNTVSNPKTSGNAAIILFESYTLSSAKINSIQVYNRPLSTAEVQQNYNIISNRFV